MKKTTENSDPTIPVGDVAFFDNYIPSLEDGSYTIQAQMGITGDIDTENYFDNPIKQAFEVRGPQFTLPATEVHSVYPPLNSNSIYDQFLPNIVLNKRVLPWERYLDENDKTMPWVCLLVFQEGEIAINPETNSPLTNGTVTEFLSSDDDVMKPSISIGSVPTDIQTSMCSSIKVSEEVFKAVAPKLDELKFLAHVRQANTGDQAIMGFEDMGWFSVVTGNRFLKTESETGTRFYVHLVSLEGYYDILNGGTWPKKKSDPSKGKDIALASLYNWTFLSQPEKLNFKELVENLAAPGNDDPDNLLLRRYVTAPQNPDASMQATLTRLENGYIPLNYKVPSGEDTFAWYRGPLTPVIAQPLPRPYDNYHYPSSSAAMIYDNTEGVFDQSYAAAWTMGRSLALADGAFSQALMNFRKKAYFLVGELMDDLESAGDASAKDLSEVVQSSVVRDTFKEMLTPQLSTWMVGMTQTPVKLTGRKMMKKTKEAAPESPVTVARSFLSSPSVQEYLKESLKGELEYLAIWLAQKQLLYDVPFDHLVPDQLMLPAESLRFFYMDQNWLDCLTDGALSIGVQSSRDAFFSEAMRGTINDAIQEEKSILRSKILGTSTGDTEADSKAEALSGVLIRSSVISGWPGLVVKGYKGDYKTGTQLKLLRMDRLSSTVLLCIFLDVPETIMLAEPQQGLCFGVEDDDVINLRKLTDPVGAPTGNEFPSPSSGGFASFYRPVQNNIGNYVLNINDGSNSVVSTLEQKAYLNTQIGPAQFALQMVKAPEEISFVNQQTKK